MRTAKLKAFPQLFAAFTEIELDNRGVKAVPLNTDATITERWLAAFEASERILRMARKAKLKSAPYLALYKKYSDTFRSKDTLFDMIVESVNDSTDDALKALKVTELEAWLVNHVLNEFFDGSLRDLLITKSDGKRKH
jgi:hypothetical protein